MLVIWETARGDRKLARWIEFLDLCRDLGILIHVTSHQHTYDVRKRRDYKTLAEEGLDSADDSELTSERLLRDKRKAAKRGLPHGRHLYGYKRIYEIGEDNRRRLVGVVPDEEVRTAVGRGGTVTEYTHAGVCAAVAGTSSFQGLLVCRRSGWPDGRRGRAFER
ncbi:hypothetical protein SAMN04489712_11611 [Thermomonospora echinospora]|uniref:Resolvase, N terminal domain n=1 Tax=Thermomonospora echinospora TaxID=1992 RepID=A0A1H6DDT1_9ACTN|nr:hypothetical protein SAMN04489712_11611 [Thermomonospora echinospora]